MVLKTIVGNRILIDVLRHNQKSDKVEWRVLVVDKFSIKILNSTIKMHQLSAEGITLVETLERRREPMPNMEAIYFITPTEESITLLMNDFKKGSLYKAAHVYTTEEIPETLFSLLSKSEAAKKMKSLLEVNLSFTAYESKVFTMDIESASSVTYSDEKTGMLEKMAEQLATLCSTLGEFPSIRYRAECGLNKRLAEILEQRLTAYKEAEPSMGEGVEKARSQLIILDRGFDITSPLLHELTFQAMAYDLLNIKNDLYKYSTDNESKEVILDENDDLWEEMRHQHIAVIYQNLQKKLKRLTDDKPVASLTDDKKKDERSQRDLGLLIKKTPQYLAEKAKVSKHLALAEECMKNYQGYIDKICKVEQDLAMGADADGEKIRDQMRNIVPVLLDTNVSINDKIRVIILYILHKQGIPEENLNKLVQHAQIPQDKVGLIRNVAKLGVTIVNDDSKSQNWTPKRRDRFAEVTYQMSRWNPVVKDLIEDAIEGKLDTNHFPFLNDKRGLSNRNKAPASNRYGRWHKDKGDQTRNVSRVIVFILGGATYSEARVGYEISHEKSPSWEVLIGGDTPILTPEGFLQNIGNLESVHENPFI